MKTFTKFLVAVFCLSALIGIVGCQNSVRFIHAKAKSLENIPDFDHLVTLVKDDENLPASEKPKANDLRTGALDFYAVREKDLNLYGDPAGTFTILMLAVSQPNTNATYPLPVEISIQTSSPHALGEATHNGFAEVKFGGSGDVFTTDKNQGFFELKVEKIYEENGDRIASGSFSLIARNKNDNQDPRRLCLMDGAFVARIK